MRGRDKNIDFSLSALDIDEVINEVWTDSDLIKEEVLGNKDGFMANIKKVYPSHTKIEDVLVKVTILNSFYSTVIYDVYSMAEHIVQVKDIDKRIEAGDLSVVNDISHVTLAGTDYNFYSFATKYCSLHNPEKFPIYDSYVEDVLIYLKNTKKLESANFKKQEDLKDIGKFKNLLCEILEKDFGHQSDLTLKKLDMYLWALGKKYFPKY